MFKYSPCSDVAKVGRKTRPVTQIPTLHKGLVQATPSTRTLELRVADITISSVPAHTHAQQGLAGSKFEVATGSANSSLELTTNCFNREIKLKKITIVHTGLLRSTETRNILLIQSFNFP